MVSLPRRVLHPLTARHNVDVDSAAARFQRRLVLLSLTVFAFVLDARSVVHAETRAFLSRSQFRKALQKPVSVSWTRRPLAEGIRQMSASRRVAILIDRNLDPGHPVTVSLRQVSFLSAIQQIAEKSEAGVSIVGNVLYVGPEATTSRLRTVIELLANGLADDSRTATNRRGLDLVRRRQLAWNDLDSPHEILNGIAERYGLKLQGTEAIPHDLWTGVTIPDANAVEQLMLVLAQFDSAFEFNDDLSAIRVAPMPESPTLERVWSLRTATLRQRAADAAQRWPDISADLKGTRLAAKGTFEQLEQIDRLLNPQRYAAETPPRQSGGELRFTARLRGSLLALIKGIDERSDLTFEFDEDELRSAGVRLDRQIDTELKNASVEELCETLLAGTGVSYEISDRTVHLTPAR